MKRLKKRLLPLVMVMAMVVSLCMPYSEMTSKAEDNTSANVAKGKEIILNDSIKGDQRATNSKVVTDGKTAAGWESAFFVGVEQDHGKDSYITIDLGESYDISMIRYFGLITPDYASGYVNTPYNQVFRISNDPNFEDDSTKTVFNSDKDNFFGFGAGTDEPESSKLEEGRVIKFPTTNARYVRYYQYGSQTAISGNYPTALGVSEIEVYEGSEEEPQIPIGNEAYGAKVTGSEFNSNGDATEGWWGGWSNNDLQEITNGQANSDHWKAPTKNPGGDKGENVFVTLDMGKVKELSTIKIWSKVGGTFLNQIVQVSENGTDWKNVYNSDKENQAGQDPTDSGKEVCGGKLTNGTITGVSAGHDDAYQETTTGMTIDFEKTDVRYIRWWSSGQANNELSMMIQLQAFNRHVVTFDYNDGSGRKDVVTVDEGNMASRPENPISAELGMLFDKWTVDKVGGEEWDFATPITGDVTLVANWKKVGFSTVTFDSDGGTEVAPIKVTNGLAVAKPENPEKEGKVFAGWKLDGAPYNFGAEVTKDITLKATWVDPAAPNAVKLHAGLLDITLDSHGNVTNLISTLDGTDYFNLEPDGKVRSLISLVAAYNIETPTGVTYDEEKQELVFDFASINAKATVKLEDNGNYTSLTLEKVDKPEAVALQAVLWGPIKTTIQDGGQTVGAVYDDNYAIGMHMLNSKTIGGWPIEFKEAFYPSDLPPVNGYPDPRVTRNIYSNTAAFSTWGSALQGYTWDYTKDTMRTVAYYPEVAQMQPAMTGKYADELASMLGSSIALYGTRSDNILNVISNIEITEGLPRPTIDGEWQKESLKMAQDFLVFNDAIWGNVENDAKMANAAGIKHIYGQYGASGPWTSDGSFQFNGNFGGSDENAKKMVEEAAKYGVYIGTHTLSNLISYHDANARPEASDILSYAGFAALTRDVSADDTTIYVKDGYPFSDEVVNATGGRKEVRIGKEFLTFTQCTQVGEDEWALTGCARGGNGTKAAEHKKGENAYKLWHYYGSLVAGWDGLDQLTDRIGDVMNNVGIHSMSYDSFESTKYSVYSSILEGMYMKKVYENVKAGGNADGFITEASDMDSVVWDVHSRISWGESNTPINTMVNYLTYYRKNFFPAMLGWSYDHGNHGGYSEPNLLMNLAMKGGWNAGTGWYVNRNTFNQYPYMPELIKTWNNAIQKGAFVVHGEYTEEIQSQLRSAWTNGRVWTLTEDVADKEWTLQEVNKSNLDEKIGEPVKLTATNNINIDRDAIENGDVATNVSRDYARKHSGEEVTVYTQAYTGCEMKEDSLKVTAKDGTDVTLTAVEGEEGAYTFTMPEQDVDITAEFVAKEDPEIPEEPSAIRKLLQMTYDKVKDLDTSEAVDSAAKEFEDALQAAKELLDNPTSTDDEMLAAWNRLVDATHGLGLEKGDKTILKVLIDQAEDMVKHADKYVEKNWQLLLDELEDAKVVMDDPEAMDDTIQPAEDELLNAILVQRYKANKDNLKELIDKANGLDLSKYTKESVNTLKAALKAADAVMADDSLSIDDQAKVAKAEKELQAALDGLKLASNDGNGSGDDGKEEDKVGGTPTTPKKDKDNEKNAPKTGDTMNVAVWLMLMAAVVVTVEECARRKRR